MDNYKADIRRQEQVNEGWKWEIIMGFALFPYFSLYQGISK